MRFKPDKTLLIRGLACFSCMLIECIILHHCVDSRRGQFLWNVFEAIQ